MTRWLPNTGFALFTLLACGAGVAQQPPLPPSASELLQKLPMSFEQDNGQAANAVDFTAKGDRYSVSLANGEAVLVLSKDSGDHNAASATGKPGLSGQEFLRPAVVRMRIDGANRSSRVSGEQKLPGTVNYLIGNDSTQWRSNIPTYAKVRYSGIYPGIDLVYYGNQHQLEYDFVVAPGADPARIALRFGGAKNVRLERNGDLAVNTEDGQIVFQKPVVYQSSAPGGERRLIDGRFMISANNRVSFSLGSYDRGQRLVIDPVLIYSTFLGGPGGNEGGGIAVDSLGSAYITGATNSGMPVTSGAFETTLPSGTAAFVSKLNASGTALEYSTYLGGNQDTNSPSANYSAAYGITVDASGSAYIVGSTYSTNFPTTSGALLTTNTSPTFYGVASPMAFLTKLDPTGAGLAYSTYLGPPTNHGTFNGFLAKAVAVDASGNAYVTGWASSGLMTTLGSFQATDPNGQADPFVLKINPTGTALVYGTYISGTNNWGTANGIAVDAQGNAYIAGATAATDFPVTSGAFQTVNNDQQGCTSYCSTNAFITELNASGSALVYSTYLGGSGGGVRWADVPTAFEGNGGFIWDGASSIAVDAFGSAYVAGFAFSQNFPTTPGVFQTTNYAYNNGGFTPFVAKFGPAGALEYSTFVGGGGVYLNGDAAAGIAVDTSGNAYITGLVHSPDFPLSPKAFQPSQNFPPSSDETAFVAKLNADATGLSYSTYLGGSSPPALSSGSAIALGSNGGTYVTGLTTTGNFPVTSGAYQTTIQNTNPGNAFVAKFNLGSSNGTFYESATSVTVKSPQSVGQKVTFVATVTSPQGKGTPTGTVVFGAGYQGSQPYATERLNAAGETEYSTTYSIPGSYTVYATYSGDANFTANSAGAATVTIQEPPTSISVVSGSGQSTVYGTSFPQPLVVEVTDSTGQPLPGEIVKFSGAGLEFSSDEVTTGSNGQASVTATPKHIGSLTASAAVNGVTTPATFALTATKAELTVAADNESVAYQQPIPALTYTITGFVNGDTQSVVTGSPKETTTATEGSAPGTYPITIGLGSLAATNYRFTFENGTLTITAP
jgi:hypothetical protein